jgi:hypothetical protein
MSEGEMVFLFCAIYSGVLSVVVWTNLIAGERIRVHLRTSDFNGESAEKLKEGA